MKKTFITTAFASVCLASFAEQTKEVQPSNEKVTTEAVKQEESCRLSIFQTIEDNGFGSFSGQIQSLTTYRNLQRYTDFERRGHASTLALTLNYTSPE
ncbi:MAG: hypothetical protein ACRC37_02570, partial [Lentisphaeria bacterium]